MRRRVPPSLLVATSHVETMISRWRMEDVQRRKKGKEGKDLIHRLRALASMLLFSQEVPFNRVRGGMNK